MKSLEKNINNYNYCSKAEQKKINEQVETFVIKNEIQNLRKNLMKIQDNRRKFMQVKT